MTKKERESMLKDLQDQEQVELRRIQLPKGNQVIGLVEQRLGGPRMKVKCLDGKTRIARVPGRLQRRLWIREGDYVLCEPWELQADEKCDIIFKYTKTQVNHLKSKGVIKEVEEEFFDDEF